MTVTFNQQSVRNSPKTKKQINMVASRQYADVSRSSKFNIIIYNYFLDDFPKTYCLSLDDTLKSLREKIVQDTQLRMIDIKNFKDEKGRFVKDENLALSKLYQNDSKLNMEIYFNENVQISTNNKSIQYFMQDANKNDFTDIYSAIINYHNSEKGGKIIVGVQSNGLIKGINIPDQDSYKNCFIHGFSASFLNINSLLKDIEISFFRVKGQNKTSYNFHDHKKIMIIKIKGKNQQTNDNSSENTDVEENKNSMVYSPINQSVEKQSLFSDNFDDTKKFLQKIEKLLADQNQNSHFNGYDYFENLLRHW